MSGTNGGRSGRGGGTGDDPRLAQFLRGVTMGALVGAAIAGSAIWRRRLARSAELTARPSPDVGGGRAAPTLEPAGQPALPAPNTSERVTSG